MTKSCRTLAAKRRRPWRTLLVSATWCLALLQLIRQSIGAFGHLVSVSRKEVLIDQYNIPLNHGSGVFEDNPDANAVPRGKCPVFGKVVKANSQYQPYMSCQGACGTSKPFYNVDDPLECSQKRANTAAAFSLDLSKKICYAIPGVQEYSFKMLGIDQRAWVEKSGSATRMVWGSHHIRPDWEKKCPRWIVKDGHLGTKRGNTCQPLPAHQAVTVSAASLCAIEVFKRSTRKGEISGIHFANYYPNGKCEMSKSIPNCFRMAAGGYALTSLGSNDFSNDVVALECAEELSAPQPVGECVPHSGWTCGQGTQRTRRCERYKWVHGQQGCSLATCECLLEGEKQNVGVCKFKTGWACGAGTQTQKICQKGLWASSELPCSQSCVCTEGEEDKGQCVYEGSKVCGSGTQTIRKCESGKWAPKPNLSCFKACECQDGETKPDGKCEFKPGFHCGEGTQKIFTCVNGQFVPQRKDCSTQCSCNTREFKLIGECKYTDRSHCGSGTQTVNLCVAGKPQISEKPCSKKCECSAGKPARSDICKLKSAEKCGTGIKKIVTCLEGDYNIKEEACDVPCTACSPSDPPEVGECIYDEALCGSGTKSTRTCVNGKYRVETGNCSASCECAPGRVSPPSECKAAGEEPCGGIGEITHKFCPSGREVVISGPCQIACKPDGGSLGGGIDEPGLGGGTDEPDMRPGHPTGTTTPTPESATARSSTSTEAPPEEKNGTPALAIGLGVAGVLLLGAAAAGGYYATRKKKGPEEGGEGQEDEGEFKDEVKESEEKEVHVEVDADASFWHAGHRVSVAPSLQKVQIASESDKNFWQDQPGDY